MFKRLLFVIAVVLFVSCSNSDNPPTVPQTIYPKYEIKLPQKITLTSAEIPDLNRVYDFTYDNRNRLVAIAVSGAETARYSYTYEDFEMRTVTVNDTDTYTILHDVSGIIEGVSHNGAVTPVIRDADGICHFGGRDFKMNNENDIVGIYWGSGTYMWGTFYSVLGYHNFAALITDEKLLYLATRRTAVSIVNPETGESGPMAHSQSGGEYFGGGPAFFHLDDSHATMQIEYKRAYQYEDIERL